MAVEDGTRSLIGNKTASLAALLLTGLVAAQTFRGAFAANQHHSRWLFPLFFSVPRWTFLTLQFAFIGYLLWVGFVFFRAAAGKERIIVAAWSFAVFSGPVSTFLPRFAVRSVECVAALGMLAAFLATVDIFSKQFSRNPAN